MQGFFTCHTIPQKRNLCVVSFYYCSNIAQRGLLGRDVMRCLLTLADGLDSASYGSIYPSVQNLLLAARAAGLGATWTTLPLWSPWLVRQALRLWRRVLPCAVVPLGWPMGRYG
jgi:nitroreductase